MRKDRAGNQALSRFLHRGPAGATEPPPVGGAPAEDDTAGALDFMEDQTAEQIRGEQREATKLPGELPRRAVVPHQPREQRRAASIQAEEDAILAERAASTETDPSSKSST